MYVVIIKLGTNDTKPKNWEHKGEFASDLKAMIDHFQALPAKPKIFLCNPVPAFPERWGIEDTRIREGVIPIVKKVARENKLPTIDLYTPFIGRAKLVPDKIHPNAAGAALMTRIIATRLIDANIPADYHAVYIQNFYDPESMSEFQFTDKKIWKIEKQQRENAAPQAYLEHFARAKYKYKVRSPYNISLIATQKFGSFILDVDMLQTGKNYGHRDMCIFYNFQNRSQFYYTHIAATTDPHAHNIFIVNEKPRTSISKTTTKGHDWGSKQWHHVRLIRDIESGKIEIYVNDMSKPIMTANDKTFGLGHVGFGSFDDTGRVTNIRIWAKEAIAVKEPGKLFED